MAVDVLKLKKAAVAAGMDKDEARKATRAVLEAFLAKKQTRTVAKKKTTGAPAKKKTTPARKPAAKKATVKTTRKPAAKKSAPAKAPATRKTAKRPATPASDGSGRNLLGQLDFTVTDGWNPRAGSAVDIIFRALKKYRGNVDKTFDALVGNIGEFVGVRMQDGTKRTKANREDMLRYRISRTKFDFAIRTGQHEIATERVAYGTGPYATTRKVKPARKASAKPATKPNTRKATTRKPAAKKTAARRR